MIFEPVIPNVPRYYTAIAEWIACLVYVLILKKRYSAAGTAGILVGGLAVQMLIQLADGMLPEILWVPGMLVAVASMGGLIMLCCEM